MNAQPAFLRLPAFTAALLLATLAAPTPAFSVPKLRLDFVPIVYYQFTGVGMAWYQTGHFDTLHGIVLAHGETIATPPDFPDAAFDKPLIAEADWAALGRLSPEALANFELILDGDAYMIAGRGHRRVRLRDDAELSTGPLLNISTRAWVGEGSVVAIAGFVIEERPRTILIRGVGPTLAELGVADFIADPFITVFKGNTPFHEDTDWEKWEKAQKVAAAKLVNAFPLREGSKDAALLIELSPGAYTVHMGVESGAPGIGLVEVYVLPDSKLLYGAEAPAAH